MNNFSGGRDNLTTSPMYGFVSKNSIKDLNFGRPDGFFTEWTLYCSPLKPLYNARFYGYPDYYGEVDEFIYNNIEYFSLFSHGFIIYSLVNFKAIRNRLRDIASFIRGMSYHTVNFTVL